MRWSVVPFGRYRGKSLPEIIVLDLDWFFWVLPKLYGRLETEARDLARKLRAIKIRKRHRRKFEVEYRYEFDSGSVFGGRFCSFAFVKGRLGRHNGRQDFRTSTWRFRLVRRSITNERAES
jgi:hypothetical protein